MSIPIHHKEIVKYFREFAPGHFRAINYGDNSGRRTVMVAEFGKESSPLFSTVGLCDESLPIPVKQVELAAIGKHSWLPNALASSAFWLADRNVESWPLVCEDVVMDNAKSTYRHMAYVPSNHCYVASEVGQISWLLGFPITDTDVGLQLPEALKRAKSIYPQWLSNEA